MASLALGVAGAGIGAFFGGPLGAKLGFSAGVLLGGALFPQGQQDGGRGRLDDLRVSGSGFGVMIPQIHGRARVGGNVIWATDLVESEGDSGTGAGKGDVPQQYTYSVSCAVAVCRGPIKAIKRIWAEDKVIYDDRLSPPSAKHQVAIYTGTESQTQDPTMVAAAGAANVPAYRGTAYIVLTDFQLAKWGNRIPNFNFEVDAGPATVASVFVDLAVQAGLAGDDLAYGAATGAVTGFVLADRTSAADAIGPVLQVFATDLAETEGQLVLIPQGAAVGGAIASADLGAHVWDGGGGEPPTRLEVRRAHDLELPGRQDLTYFAAANQYEQGTQSGIRYCKPNSQDASALNTPLVLTDDQARRAAERILYQKWVERTGYVLSLPPRYLKFAPGTPVTLPVNGTDQRVKLTGFDVGLFAELRVTAVADDVSILDQVVTGAGVSIDDSSADGIVPTDFAVWSCPEVRDEDGLHAGFYVAATAGADWTGATIYYSPDAGVSWIDAGEVHEKSKIGTMDAALADWTDAATRDDTNTVDVTLLRGTLASTDQASVNGGANTALIGSEIVGYRTATKNSDQHYTLSSLTRGRRATAMTAHAPGEVFIKLSHRLVRVNVDSALIGQTVEVVCVSEGEAIADVTPVSVVICNPASPYARTGPSFRFNFPSNSMYL